MAGQARQVAVQFEEHVLCHFLRHTAFSKNAKCDGEDPRLVTLHNRPKGLR